MQDFSEVACAAHAVLACCDQTVSPPVVPSGVATTRASFHGHAGKALVDHALLDDVRRAREGRLRIARAPAPDVLDVARQAFKEARRRGLDRLQDIDDHRQRFPVHQHLRRRALRDLGRRRDHRGDDLAGMPDAFDGQGVVRKARGRFHLGIA